MILGFCLSCFHCHFVFGGHSLQSFVFYVFVFALYIFHWVLLVFLFLGLIIFLVSCHLSCFYSVLSSSIFILVFTLCLEVGLCGLLSVVLLLMLLLFLDLLFLVSQFFIFLGLLCLLFLSSSCLYLSCVRLVSHHGFYLFMSYLCLLCLQSWFYLFVSYLCIVFQVQFSLLGLLYPGKPFL